MSGDFPGPIVPGNFPEQVNFLTYSNFDLTPCVISSETFEKAREVSPVGSIPLSLQGLRGHPKEHAFLYAPADSLPVSLSNKVSISTCDCQNIWKNSVELPTPVSMKPWFVKDTNYYESDPIFYPSGE